MVVSFIEASDEYIKKSDSYISGLQYEKLANATHKYIPGVSFLGMKSLEDKLLHFEDNVKKLANMAIIPQTYAEIKTLIEEITLALRMDFNIIS